MAKCYRSNKNLSREVYSKFSMGKCSAIFIVALIILCSYQIFTQLFLAVWYLMSPRHISLWRSENSNGTAKTFKVKILLYTSMLKYSQQYEKRYEIYQDSFQYTDLSCFISSVNSSMQNETVKKITSLLYQAHKKYLLKAILDFHVVVFHVKDLPGRRLLKEVSVSRPFGQIWAYYNKESPYNTINVVDGKFDNIFNATITPLRNSDIFAPYGYYYKKNKNYQSWLTKYSSPMIFEKTHAGNVASKEEKELLNMDLRFEEKDLLIAWVASNCNQLRDYYVSKLIQYLPIHVYGSCGLIFRQKRRCDKNSLNCELLLRRYKFVLAFENSFCEDYITEKYWNSIFRGNVPVVLGGSNYDDTVAIPGSYINARLFKSPRLLAEYIRFLGSNEHEYYKYLGWREHFVVDYIPNDHHRTDYIAEKIHQWVSSGEKKMKSYRLSEFYSAQKNCRFQSKERFW